MACRITSATTTLFSILLLIVIAELCSAQNYHFSNGWYAGKKRSSASLLRPEALGSSSSSSSNSGLDVTDADSSRGGVSSLSGRGFGVGELRLVDSPCSIRLETLALINKLMQEEAARIQRTCVANVPSGLRELLEGAASKLESENKW
ncbi:preprogonadotropin-releasing hormone-like protein precursor [Aplysia californica]|uniref:Preprogonadotropin-releasing hormone-like protein n=1 Tax=Aplysia californica TaxID=6500 RepID=A8WA77_APLCA|nr:preprogonadotropin-releasing hormone-like protein precursor [Aplysia californica]ABW82703.1 preprogonadotropin-releasing hormone-like protein [Aplysia californica]